MLEPIGKLHNPIKLPYGKNVLYKSFEEIFVTQLSFDILKLYLIMQPQIMCFPPIA